MYFLFILTVEIPLTIKILITIVSLKYEESSLYKLLLTVLFQLCSLKRLNRDFYMFVLFRNIMLFYIKF